MIQQHGSSPIPLDRELKALLDYGPWGLQMRLSTRKGPRAIAAEQRLGEIVSNMPILGIPASRLHPRLHVLHTSTIIMSGVTGFTKETDLNAKFLDVKKPLVAQVWNGGFSRDFYLEQVHRPQYYLRGDSAPFFGNFLGPLTTTAWFNPPIIWLPSIVFLTLLASQELGSTIKTAGYVILGLVLWPLVEYGVHRGVFHMDKLVLSSDKSYTALVRLD